MPKPELDKKIIKQIINLRQTGHSLPEIRKITGKGNATVFKYSSGVTILPKYQELLRLKQGGSRVRSEKKWEDAKIKAESVIHSINSKEKMFMLACLYWAEGRKRDFDIINSDPFLLKVFISCLQEIGVPKNLLRISLRIYEDIKKDEAIAFWIKILDIPESQLVGVSVLSGKKKGKLQYGMCRIRIVKGDLYFKQIIAIIDRIKVLI